MRQSQKIGAHILTHPTPTLLCHAWYWDLGACIWPDVTLLSRDQELWGLQMPEQPVKIQGHWRPPYDLQSLQETLNPAERIRGGTPGELTLQGQSS